MQFQSVAERRFAAQKEEVWFFHRFGHDIKRVIAETEPERRDQATLEVAKLHQVKQHHIRPALAFAHWLPSEADVEDLLDLRGFGDLMLTWDHIRLLAPHDESRRAELLREVLRQGLTASALQAKLRRRKRKSEPPQWNPPRHALGPLDNMLGASKFLHEKWTQDVDFMWRSLEAGVMGPKGTEVIAKIRSAQRAILGLVSGMHDVAAQLGKLGDHLDEAKDKLEAEVGEYVR